MRAPIPTSELIDHLEGRLRSPHLPFDELHRWWGEMQQANPGFVRIETFTDDSDAAPVQVVHIGPEDVGTRPGDSVVELVAGNHGDEEITVDVCRALGVLAVSIPAELEEKRVCFRIYPLVCGNDYRLNERRLGAQTLGAYVDGYCRSADDDVENSFASKHEHLGVKVQKRVMTNLPPSTRVSFHGSFCGLPYSNVSGDPQRLSEIQQRAAEPYKISLTNGWIEPGDMELLATGIYSERVPLSRMSSNGFLGRLQPTSMRLLTETPTWQYLPGRVSSHTLERIRSEIANRYWEQARRLPSETVSTVDRDDAFVLVAAQRRSLKMSSFWQSTMDFNVGKARDEQTFFMLRELGLLERALRVLSLSDFNVHTPELASEIDAAGAFKPINPMNVIGFQVSYISSIIKLRHDVDLFSEM